MEGLASANVLGRHEPRVSCYGSATGYALATAMGFVANARGRLLVDRCQRLSVFLLMVISQLSETMVPDIDELLAQAAGGDERAVSELLSRYRDRLRHMVGLRLDRRLYGRVDASDVVQEAVIEAARRLPDYAAKPPMEFYLWLRQLATQKLIDTHRRHLGAKKRSAGNDVSLFRAALPEASSVSLAHHLMGRLTTPTTAARRAELQLKIQEALNGLDEVDREVLVLRHFEQLSNQETATVLGLSRSAASKRYIVALARLREHLAGVPGFEEWS